MGGFSADWGVLVALTVAAAVMAVLAAFVWRKLKGAETEPFLNRQRKKMTLVDKSDVSPDTRRLVFSLDSPEQPLGLPVGQHLRLFAPNVSGVEAGKWNGKPDLEAAAEEISRKYTPVSSSSTRGRVELIVKIYRKTTTPPFVDGGKMSRFLDGLQIGDQLDVEGPFGRITYHGRGAFTVGPRMLKKRRVGLLAGGTGITPIFQLIRRIFEDHADPTHLSLIYANKTEHDILLRDGKLLLLLLLSLLFYCCCCSCCCFCACPALAAVVLAAAAAAAELEELENEYPDRISVWYTLDAPPASWRFSVGFISAQMIKEHLPPPAEDTLILCCGPPPMVEFACMQNLLQLGYDRKDIACF
ncbi:hypothetical protein Efla_006087 [Eimeria flavescens]